MKSIIEEKIEEEIVRLLVELETMETYTDGYSNNVDLITTLYKTLSNEQKNNFDSEKLKLEKLKIDNDLIIRQGQLTNEADRNRIDSNIRQGQLALDEKRVNVERDKTSNDYEFRERQLIDAKDQHKAEIELRREELQQQIDNVLKDREMKLKELNQNALSGYVKTGVEVGLSSMTLLFYYVWLKKGFEFEEEGTITSQVFKGLIGKFKPTR